MTREPSALRPGDRVLLPLHSNGSPSRTPRVWTVVARDGERLTIRRNGRTLAGWHPTRAVEVPLWLEDPPVYRRVEEGDR